MSDSHRRATRQSRSRRASWCSSRWSPASASRGRTAAGMGAPRPNRADGRIRICLVAAEHRPKTMRGEAVLDSGATRVRRATVNDLATVVALRLALLREYANHPVYGRLHPEVEARARPLFEQQIKATD